MKYLSVVVFLIISITSYAQDKLIYKSEENITEDDIKSVKHLTSRARKQIENNKKLFSTPVTCGKKEVLVAIHNTSDDEMYFEDSTTKMKTVVKPKTNRAFCLTKGDIVGGYVKHIKKEEIPAQHLMWYMKSLDITINSKGFIRIDTETVPHNSAIKPVI